MKVLHAAETIQGGVATVLRHLVTPQIASFGEANITCLVPRDQLAEMDPVPLGICRSFDRQGRGVLSFIKFAFAFAKLLWSEKPDVVHLHSTFAGALGRAVVALLWLVRRPKVVYCPHGWSFLIDTSNWKKKLMGFIERRLAFLAHVIVCVSRYERDMAMKFRVPEERMVVIYNGVHPREVAPGGALRKEPETKLKALYVGRFDRAKGLDVLLDAMQILSYEDIHLTVVGAALGVSEKPVATDNVSYAGWLKGDALSSAYASCDVVIVPSRWEGFALVPLEAMSHGKPLVCSKACSLPEVVVEGETGCLFEVGSAHDLARILKQTPRSRWQQMGQSGRVRFERHFTAAEMTKAVEATYQRVLGHASAPASGRGHTPPKLEL